MWTKHLRSGTLRGSGGWRLWEWPKPSCRGPTSRKPTGLKGARRELATASPETKLLRSPGEDRG